MARRSDPGQCSVEPIRDRDDLANFLDHFRKLRDADPEGSQARRLHDRDYMLILLGVNAALRIEDLLTLRVDMVESNHVSQRDKKTNKENKFRLNRDVHRELMAYVARTGLSGRDYLFPSRKGVNRPISRQQAYNVVREAADAAGIRYQVGTHSLRKTFGFWFYRETQDVVALQTILNHSSPAITLRYIGMKRAEAAEKKERFKIM